MAVDMAHRAPRAASTAKQGHRAWVRTCHWIGVLSFLALVFSGIFIFAVHPRLYWGEVGWHHTATFPLGDGDIFTATRRYPIFNQNGWARSLHFLAAWLLVATGLVYCITGIVTGHARKNLLPPIRDLSSGALVEEASKYLNFLCLL